MDHLWTLQWSDIYVNSTVTLPITKNQKFIAQTEHLLIMICPPHALWAILSTGNMKFTWSSFFSLKLDHVSLTLMHEEVLSLHWLSSNINIRLQTQLCHTLQPTAACWSSRSNLKDLADLSRYSQDIDKLWCQHDYFQTRVGYSLSCCYKRYDHDCTSR